MKKIISIMMSFFLCLGLVACSSANETTKQEETVVETDDESDTSNETTEPEDETDLEEEQDGYTEDDLYTLVNTENFLDSAIEHIFLGQINKKGNATGYHYDGIEDSPGQIIEGTKEEADENGVYEAQVEVNGVTKSGNGGYSSFYPESYSPQQVIDAINEAYENKELVRGNTYRGETSQGIVVEMYLDDDDKIISAFPVYGE